MCKISVIIPSYNHENFIGRAIESVLNQTFHNFEIVIVDDASLDDSLSVIKYYAKKDCRIKFFSFQENQGACAAMNRCITESRGEYIAVLNSDDMFCPEKLERQLAYLEKSNGCGAVFTWAEAIDENDHTYGKNNYVENKFEEENRSRFEWLRSFFYNGNCLCHPSILIRRECYDKIGFYNETMTQLPDFEMWIRLCLRYEIYVMPEKLLKYRLLQNEANASVLHNNSFVRYQFDYFKLMDSFLKISYEDFRRIFVNLKDFPYISEKTYLFFVAEEAFKVNIKPVQFWAVNTIYQALQNPSLKEELKASICFNPVDFHRLYSQFDVFGEVFNDSTQLYIDDGNGFSESESVMQPCLFEDGNFSFKFELLKQNKVRSLRWDPVLQRNCFVELKSSYYIDYENSKRPVMAKELSGNGERVTDQLYRFVNGDPQLYFDIDENIKSFVITGKWKPICDTGRDFYSQTTIDTKAFKLISIILPVFNNGKTVEDIVKKITSTTASGWELVVADLGSDDDTVAKVEAQLALDNRIKLIKKSRGTTPGEAINSILSQVSCNLVAILNSEYCTGIENLSQEVKFLQTNEEHCAAVLCLPQLPQGLSEGVLERHDLIRHFFYNGVPEFSYLLVHKSRFKGVGFVTELAKLYHADFLISLLAKENIYIVKSTTARLLNKSPSSFSQENLYVLKSFFQLEPEDIKAAFPAFREKPIFKETIPFIIACVALSQEDMPNIYRVFGIQTLYECFANGKNHLLEKLYHFNLMDLEDFIRGDHRKICLEKYMSCLYLDTGNGFSEQEKIVQEVTAYENCEVTFDLSDYADQTILSLKWHPVPSGSAEIHKLSAFFVDIKRRKKTARGYITNVTVSHKTITAKNDPSVTFFIKASITSFHVQCQLKELK